jgi:hypothetical protein
MGSEEWMGLTEFFEKLVQALRPENSQLGFGSKIGLKGMDGIMFEFSEISVQALRPENSEGMKFGAK